jgi:hypothetical protein
VWWVQGNLILLSATVLFKNENNNYL